MHIVELGEGNGTPLQYSCLENPMAGGAWWAAVHGVAKSRIRLSDFPFTFPFHALEKEMATHSSVCRLSGFAVGGILVPGPGIELMVPCITRQILNHWATREVPQNWSLNDHPSFAHKYTMCSHWAEVGRLSVS